MLHKYATVSPESPTSSSMRPFSSKVAETAMLEDRPRIDSPPASPVEHTPVQQFTAEVCISITGSISDQVERTASSDGCTITRIDDQMYISAQLNDQSFSDVKRLGIKTIVNIRQAAEKGFMSFEKQARSADIAYTHFPVAYDGWDNVQVDKLLSKLDNSPKPCLVFCEVGLRAAAVAVAFKESRQAVRDVLDGRRDSEHALINAEEAAIFDRMESIRPGYSSQYKGFVNTYIQSKIQNALKRPGQQKITDDFYIAGQVSEDELRKAKESGIKSVLNLRCLSEAGQFGLGLLAREEHVVREMGLEYVQISVPRDGPYSAELRAQVEQQLASLIQTHAPVLVHCRTGRRVKDILQGTKHAVENSSHDLDHKVSDYREEEAGAGPGDVARVVLVAALMGMAFGFAMEQGKVTLPVVIREQFLFERFIMLKMFLAAAASSALWLAVLSLAAPVAFHRARVEYMGCGAGKGLWGVAFGAMVLGAGMAIGGSCPGMVLVQVGSGVANSGVTVAGGLAASALYGVLQPAIVPWLTGGMVCQQKAEDFKRLEQLKYWQMALGLAAAMAGVIAVVEVLAPWESESELPAFGEPWRNTWPPILSGCVIGFLQVPAVLWLGDTLGSSTSYMTFTSQWLAVSQRLQERFPHWNGFRLGLGNWWQLLYIFAAIGGAFLSASTAGTLGAAEGVPVPDAFVGGFLIIFGSRIASGCTSGHGLSGMALLSVHSMVATPAMFLGGIVTAFAYNAATPSFIV